jgi:hypothetical protein
VKLATLAQMQRWATTDLRQLGLDHLVAVVMWGGEPGGDGLGGTVDPGCARRGRWMAHAHIHETGEGVARICVRRGLSVRNARELIRHEVAHFARGGTRHGDGHVAAMAALGSKQAKARRVRQGKARCPRHVWTVRQEIERKVTARGIVIRYTGRCVNCGREVGS